MKFRTSIISFVFTAVAVFPQNTQTNYNDYYRFPFSLGVEYQSMQPVQSYDEEYTIMDFSADFRIPLPGQPTLQPFLKLGLTNLDSRDISYPEKWDHYHLYSHLGLGYTNRFAKNFEVGADFQSGVSQAVFPDAVDTGPVGALYWQVEGAAKISLDPSYSYSIDIRPSLRYQKSLQPLDKFDGFLAGLGFAVNFRFGEDPDSAAALMRFLRFDEIQVDPVFSAMQSYYVRNPIGRAQITNTGRSTLTDLQVSFMQAGFMDSPTIAARFPELKPGKPLPLIFPQPITVRYSP